MPLAPEMMEIHEVELEAVHGHVLLVVTATLPVVAPADTDVALGVME